MSLSDAFLVDPYPFEIWIAVRTDDAKGSGTLYDPYDGRTAAKFDKLMNDNVPANARVHLGPGIFQTNGYSDEVATGGWQPKTGLKIVGAGIDVTTLQIASLTTSTMAHVFAVGHALVADSAANLVDSFELSDLTVDCNLGGQIHASQIACGAVRIMGNHSKISRIKVKNWGTKTGSQPCFVVAMITGQVVGLTVTEVSNCGIDSCIALTPAAANVGPVTLFHVGGKEDAGVAGEPYGLGPYIRNCFADGGTLTITPEIRGLSMGWCRAGIVEGNAIYNVRYGGPYQDKASSRDLVVRANYYKNVAKAVYWKLGGTSSSIGTGWLTQAGPIVTVSLAGHKLSAGDRVKIATTPPIFSGIVQVSNVETDSFKFITIVTTGAPAMVDSVVKVYGVGRLTVEDNVIELATGISAPDTAIHIDDAILSGHPPDYAHGDIAVRGNKIRYLDGLLDSNYVGSGIQVNGAKSLNVRDNVIESTDANPMTNNRCGFVTYFNNRTPSGVLIRGLNQDTGRKYDELETRAEEALILSLFNRRTG